MKKIILNKDNSSDKFLYEQLYTDIKKQILNGEMEANEKCPSIRRLAEVTGVSITTVMDAYGQLLAEGYIRNKPGSGYFVEYVSAGKPLENMDSRQKEEIVNSSESSRLEFEMGFGSSEYLYDEESFDFNRWKKCSAKVFTEYSDELLYGSDLKGELTLRNEISRYLFRSRGVDANPENIIIAAGTQQIAFHLGRILKAISINLIAVENPGYIPVKSMFQDALFTTADIPVTEEGISIRNLPVNISSAVYVNPSNQFPTGVVMPASRRYEILKWADENKSYVIEDDYNSELRYFGKPLPTIKSLDSNDRVIYLGSFSSTLFSAIKISYMVLPDELVEVFESNKKNYSQTCSKAEQLTLAYYMAQGYYYTAIRKKRALYSKKLQVVISSFTKYGGRNISLENTNSGLTVIIRINTKITGQELVNIAKEEKVHVSYIDEISTENEKRLAFYYSYIPINQMERVIEELVNRWKIGN